MSSFSIQPGVPYAYNPNPQIQVNKGLEMAYRLFFSTMEASTTGALIEVQATATFTDNLLYNIVLKNSASSAV